MPANDPISGHPVHVNARGMKCPWPALRAARAMRDAHAIIIDADDPIASRELEALAQQNGWTFLAVSRDRFALGRVT
ncbi:sulfurtransferase TusA family protein [Sphingobium sp. AP49]|uniref:sulfurtransferase TusA family protein n=1 Tax=Sphingobium sp. AP49 TaxID=1144307 RepID=UPI00055CDB5B|nr:sulfurtransferase TusA family protein [Sphingobium sp. AP49]WHO40153.1 sulfurtransferase TusA family protein [Sphingobium sp. AP49]